MIFSSRSFQTLAAIVCLLTLSPSALAVQIAQALIAQTPINCSAERTETTIRSVNEQIARVLQLVNDRQTDAATQALIAALQSVNRLEDPQAKSAWLDQIVNSIPANPSVLEQLITQASPQQRQRVVAVLPQAIQVAQSLNSGYSAAKTRTFISIARYYVTLGQPQQSQAVLGQALQASRSLRGADFQASALVEIAQAYLTVRQPQTATPLIAQALQIAQSIANPNRKAATLAQISNLHVQVNQLDRALAVARSIAVPYYQSVAMLTIVDKYVGANQVDRALELLQTVPQADLKSNMLAIFAGRIASRQPQQAAQLYNQAIATAQTLPAGYERDQALANVALRYAEYGQLEPALAMIRGLSQPGAKIPALGVIAATYANLGQGDRAQTTLSEALTALAAISDSGTQTSLRNTLIEQVLRGGRFDQAMQIAATVQPNEATPFDRVEILTDLATRAAAGSNTEAALQIVEQIPPSFVDRRDRIFEEIARAYARREDFDRAVQIAQRASKDTAVQPRILAQVATIIHQMGYSGYPERAAQIFAQALQSANRLQDVSAKAEAIAAIAIEHNRIGQTQQGSELIAQAIATSELLPDRIDQFSVLSRIAENLIAANQYRAAIQVAEVIPEESERVMRLDQAIEKAVSVNDFAIVLPVLDRLDNPRFKTRWLIAIADRNTQQGQTQRAVQLLNQALQSARVVPGDEAQTIVVRGGEAPLTVDDEQDRGSFYEAIALRFARLNQTGRALEVARLLQNAQARQQLTQRIGCYR